MDRKTEILLGQWAHSAEEDTGDVLVFRQQDYPLPPSRGRRKLAFYPGNQVKSAGVAPNDVNRVTSGTWASVAGSDADFEMVLDDGDGPCRLSVADDGAPILKLKKRSSE
ncbi:hypothetical protein [Mesorhizobium sp. KR9-304]|uniref:hypothetical protein n=1 Tax=Mesorhizobium sp. KR9-304 TaxID=3156614 RepID=UPI0032B45DC9